MSRTEEIEIVMKLHHIINDKDFVNFAEFFDYVMLLCTDEEYEIAVEYTEFFAAYIASRWEIKQREQIAP